jgi:hypothetical protein
LKEGLLVFLVLVEIGLVGKAKLGYVFVQIGHLEEGKQINPNEKEVW